MLAKWVKIDCAHVTLLLISTVLRKMELYKHVTFAYGHGSLLSYGHTRPELAVFHVNAHAHGLLHMAAACCLATSSMTASHMFSRLDELLLQKAFRLGELPLPGVGTKALAGNLHYAKASSGMPQDLNEHMRVIIAAQQKLLAWALLLALEYFLSV